MRISCCCSGAWPCDRSFGDVQKSAEVMKKKLDARINTLNTASCKARALQEVVNALEQHVKVSVHPYVQSVQCYALHAHSHVCDQFARPPPATEHY